MKTIFVCGPYVSGYGIEKNTLRAIAASQYLRNHGYNVFCPHVGIAGYCSDMDDRDKEDHKKIMAMCLQWVEICDMIAIIPGYEKSINCQAEYTLSEVHGKEKIFLTNKQIESMM